MKINSFFYVSKETRLMTFKINKQEAKIQLHQREQQKDLYFCKAGGKLKSDEPQ